MNILERAKTVYQASRDVNVNYEAQRQIGITIADGFGLCYWGSVYVFDINLNLLLYNNRFDTLKNATAGDLRNMSSLANYMQRHYSNVDDIVGLANKVLHNKTKNEVLLLSVSGGLYKAECHPITCNKRLTGIALIVSEAHERAQIRGGERC